MATRLTAKQSLFIEAYLICLNATEAAKRASYRGNRATMAAIGYENLRKPHIAKIIKERLAERAMGADEVIDRVTSLARGSFANFLNDDLSINYAVVKRQGHLIKSLRHTKEGDIILELHDAPKNLALLGKYHRLWVDRIETETKQVDKFTTDEYSKAAADVEQWEKERFET